MKKNRELLHKLLVKDGRLKPAYNNFDSFNNHYFSDDSGVNKVWSVCNTVKYKTGPKKGEIIFKNDISKFYKLYACDLSWTKQTSYCGGGGNTSQGWEPDPTGNQTWEYQVRDCKWIARKKGQTKEYNISDNPKYKSSVDTLNQKLPNLVKDCNKPSQTQPQQTQSTPQNVVVGGQQPQVQDGSATPTGSQPAPNQAQGLGVPNVSELGLDEIDKLVNPVKPEDVTTTQKESVEDNTDILKEEFYSTLKKIS